MAKSENKRKFKKLIDTKSKKCYNYLNKNKKDKKMLHSYHNHTYRCNHASGSEREFIEKAIAEGIKTLGFSDHAPMPFDNGYYSHFRMKLSETEDYIKTLVSLRDEYKNDIKIHIGFEAEYYPDVFPRMIDFLSDYPYEYLILGQHALGNEQNDHYCSAKTTDKTHLTRYVDQVIEGISTGRYIYIAHPDILNYVGDNDFYIAEMSRLCGAAKENDVLLEINVLGMREGRNYPNPEFWKIAAEQGCTAILGQDAHHVSDITAPKTEQKAIELARQSGIRITKSLEDRLEK